MKCECCMDCYKIDCCDLRCDFKCGKCNMNKNNKLKEKETTKDLNGLIERKLNHIRSTYIPRCEECLHWKIEWDEYYDNSCCLLKIRGMSCNKEVSPRILEGRVRESINQDFNDIDLYFL